MSKKNSTSVQAQQAQVMALQAQLTATTAALAGMAAGMLTSKVSAPPHTHPLGWTEVITRDLHDDNSTIFDVQQWLRAMAKGAYDFRRTSQFGMEVYFEEKKDAAMFKLTWGGV